MKNTKLLLACILTLTLCCCKNAEEQQAPENETAAVDTLATEKANPLAGTVYREISEIREFQDYEHQASNLIYQKTNANKNYRYAISQYGNEKNYLLVFQELIEEKGNPKVKYKILDTLNITKLAIDEHIAAGLCRLDKNDDSEIIAIVKAHSSDDIEYYDHIIKAWRADTLTHKIVPINDLKGIDCFNEGYGI